MRLVGSVIMSFNLEDSKHHRWEILTEFIREKNFKYIAEVGVFRGENAKNILQLCDLRHFFLIDPRINPEFYSWILENNKPASFLKMSSADAISFFKDESLDLVFIDASHGYPLVKADVNSWLPKVRKGGILCGHDYDHLKFPGVKQAVDEILGSRINLIIEKEIVLVKIWWVEV